MDCGISTGSNRWGVPRSKEARSKQEAGVHSPTLDLCALDVLLSSQQFTVRKSALSRHLQVHHVSLRASIADILCCIIADSMTPENILNTVQGKARFEQMSDCIGRHET